MEALALEPGHAHRHHRLGRLQRALLSRRRSEARSSPSTSTGAHIALTRLKLAAARHLPTYDAFYRFFGEADEEANVDRLSTASCATASTRDPGLLGGPQLATAAAASRSSPATSTATACSATSSASAIFVAKLYGVDPREMLQRANARRAARLLRTSLAPLFDKRFVRWATSQKPSRSTASAFRRRSTRRWRRRGSMAGVLKQRARAARLRLSALGQLFRLAGFRPRLCRGRRRRRCRPISRAREFRRDPRPRRARRRWSTAPSPSISRASRPPELDRLCAARCAGLDDRCAA